MLLPEEVESVLAAQHRPAYGLQISWANVMSAFAGSAGFGWAADGGQRRWTHAARNVSRP